MSIDPASTAPQSLTCRKLTAGRKGGKPQNKKNRLVTGAVLCATEAKSCSKRLFYSLAQWTSRQYSFLSSHAKSVKKDRNKITQTPQASRFKRAGSPT